MKVNDLDVTVKSETFWGMSAKWVSSAFHLTTLQSPGLCCLRDPVFYFRMPKVEAESWLCLPTVVYCVYLGGHLSSDISPGDHPLPQTSDLGTYPLTSGGDHFLLKSNIQVDSLACLSTGHQGCYLIFRYSHHLQSKEDKHNSTKRMTFTFIVRLRMMKFAHSFQEDKFHWAPFTARQI